MSYLVPRLLVSAPSGSSDQVWWQVAGEGGGWFLCAAHTYSGESRFARSPSWAGSLTETYQPLEAPPCALMGRASLPGVARAPMPLLRLYGLRLSADGPCQTARKKGQRHCTAPSSSIKRCGPARHGRSRLPSGLGAPSSHRFQAVVDPNPADGPQYGGRWPMQTIRKLGSRQRLVAVGEKRAEDSSR